MHPRFRPGNPRRLPRPARPVRSAAAVIGLAAGVLALGACGSEEPELSAEAARGLEVATDAGCMGCHGADGQGGVGPAWTGLAGSTVELEDGGSVTADADYLHRSIVDPSAEIVTGYTLRMPENQLSDEEVAAVVAYIQELG